MMFYGGFGGDRLMVLVLVDWRTRSLGVVMVATVGLGREVMAFGHLFMA